MVPFSFTCISPCTLLYWRVYETFAGAYQQNPVFYRRLRENRKKQPFTRNTAYNAL
jgi:hypothetical protein